MDKFVLLELTKQKKNINSFSKSVNDTLEFIKQNYLSSILLEDIANAVKYNKYYLCRVFKKETGFSIQEFVSILRVEQAKELLADSDLPLTEIAYASGLASQSYFCYLFKKIEGLTPYHYRMKYGKKQTKKK